MIEAKKMAGFRHIDVLRREIDGETEFATLMWFDSLDCVTAFVGADCEIAHVPDVARALLKRFDQRVPHYEVIDRRPQ
jgi:heme-degrading monooxygenase HmoA